MIRTFAHDQGDRARTFPKVLTDPGLTLYPFYPWAQAGTTTNARTRTRAGRAIGQPSRCHLGPQPAPLKFPAFGSDFKVAPGTLPPTRIRPRNQGAGGERPEPDDLVACDRLRDCLKLEQQMESLSVRFTASAPRLLFGPDLTQSLRNKPIPWIQRDEDSLPGRNHLAGQGFQVGSRGTPARCRCGSPLTPVRQPGCGSIARATGGGNGRSGWSESRGPG